MAASAAWKHCPGCGATNPSSATYCQQCQQALPSPGVVSRGSTPPSTDPLSLLEGRRIGPVGPLGAVLGGAGLLWFALGIAMAIIGIFLLVAATLVVLVANASDQNCSMNLLCATSPGLHVAFVVTGLLALLIGIVLIIYGFHRSLRRSSWLTLPP